MASWPEEREIFVDALRKQAFEPKLSRLPGRSIGENFSLSGVGRVY